jgi:hypothetical protein
LETNLCCQRHEDLARRFDGQNNFNSMSSDELWKLHEEVTAQLANKLAAEKAELLDRERRLRKALNSLDAGDSHARPTSFT